MRKWVSITIENNPNIPEEEREWKEEGIEWIAIDVEGKEYSGFWQRGKPLTDEELDIILNILENKTDKLYTKKDWEF